MTPGTVDVVTGSQVYTLVAKATASNATITGYNFTFGDTKTQTLASADTSVSVPHTYAPGSYTAQVEVTATANGKNYTATAPACQANITVQPAPAAACESLQAIVTDRIQVALNAKASTAHDATIQGYDFVIKNDANAVVAQRTVTSGNTTATTNVTLNDAGTYQAQVTVRTSLGALTGAQCTTPITIAPPATPNVTITKYVDNVKREQVAVGKNFVYEVKVTNTGSVDLTNVVVTDPAPQGVTMVSTDTGTIADNGLSYTIPSLKAGASVTINITATVATFVAGDLVNTACVNAPQVNPDQPDKTDACDTATVTLVPLPPQLPNTGAGNVIAIVAGAVAAGTIGARLFIGRKLARR
jgi:uncharacterized repeat protein (TIGR01451 family)/LPXTG-motif cell wall-anchored protein